MVTKAQAVNRVLLVGLLFGLIAAGRSRPMKKTEKDYDAPTVKALKEAETEQAKDDKQLAPQALAAKEKKLGELDAFVSKRADKFPQSLAVQSTASHYSLRRGDFKAAAARAEQALSLSSPEGDPKLTAEMLVVRGTAKYSQGDVPGAYADGLQAAELDKTNRAAIELVKYTENRGPRVEQGLESKDSAEVARLSARQAPTIPHTPKEWAERQEQSPTPASEAVLKAMAAHKRGDLAGAMAHSEEALRLDPNDPMAVSYRGFARRDMKDYNGAVVDLSRAIALGWDDPILFSARAQSLLAAGSPEQARAALHDADLAVRLDPSNAGAWNARSMAKVSLAKTLDQFSGALADLKRAAELDPKSFSELYDKALASYEQTEAKEKGRQQTEQLRKDHEAAVKQARAKREETAMGQAHNRLEDAFGAPLPARAVPGALGGLGALAGLIAIGVIRKRRA